MTPMNWGTFGCGRRGLARCPVVPYNKFTCRSGAPFTGGFNVDILSTFSFPSRESFEVIVSGGSTFARVKLKEIDGMAPQDVERAV
jgi:hypothetical protein